jgi:tRNA(fMet)-specific endonuclease VapC
VTVEFLLDTNVISEPLRPYPNSKVLKQLRKHHSRLAIPSVVWHELLVGCYRLPASQKRLAIERYLKEVCLPILPYDSEAAQWHAIHRVRLSSMGLTPPFIDGQIAAIATINKLTQITFNTKDFKHFQELNVLDWHL